MTTEQALEVVDPAIEFQYNPRGSTRSYDEHYPGYVVGIDLCGNPMKGNVSIFTPAFEKAMVCGLGITAHFAEVPQSSTDTESTTIFSWQPDKLGHCIHVPPQTKMLISSRHIGLELCLSCNVLAKITTVGFAKHHFGEWIQMIGSPMALGTDDFGIFGSPLSTEYLLAAENFGLGKEALVMLSRSATHIAFAGRTRMMELLDSFERELRLAKTSNVQ